MHENNGGAHVQRIRPRRPLQPEQVTLGEAIAFGRFAAQFATAPIKLTDEQLWHLVYVLNVCTTCGWSPQIHTIGPAMREEMRVCENYAQTYAQGDSA